MSASPGALQAPSDHARAPAQPPKIAVGIALKREKRKKHISDKLVALAAEAGVELRFVEKDVPLEQQGPFVAIFQKVRKPEWERHLESYAAGHPETHVFDMPAATYPLRNRGTMFSFLHKDGWLFEEPAALVEPGRAPQLCRCNVPTNTTLAEGISFEAAAAQMEAAGLSFPVLAKPLWADGRDGSHALAVVHTPQGLGRLVAGEVAYLQLPIMLQQYVDHGGCLFKVYVLGDTSVRVKRNSLHLPPWTWITPPPAGAARVGGPQAAEGGEQQPAAVAAAVAEGAGPTAAGRGNVGGEAAAAPAAASAKGAVEALLGEDGRPAVEMMERVSAYPATKSWGRADTAPKGHGVPSPPAWLLQALAQRLRAKTGLNLFNFDVIVPMHLHRRQLPHAASAPAAAAAAAEASGSQAQQNSAHPPLASANTPAVPGGDEEPAAIDLRVAAAAEAAAAGGPAATAGANAAVAGQQEAGQRQQQAGQQQQPSFGQQAGQQEEQQQDPEELLYHLIDINYFPGYEKMPDYEHYMVQFLRSICFPQQQQQQRQAGAASP